MAQQDELFPFTSAGVYTMFARPTMEVLRRRFRTGNIEEDVTPGFMPGLSEYLRGPGGRGADLSGDFLRGGPQFADIMDPRQAMRLGRYGERVRQTGLDLAGAQSELGMQQQGLIKSIQAQQAVRGLEGSPAAEQAFGLGLETFQQQAAGALAPLIEANQRAKNSLQLRSAMTMRAQQLAAEKAKRAGTRIAPPPRRGSLFFATPGSQFGAERRR